VASTYQQLYLGASAKSLVIEQNQEAIAPPGTFLPSDCTASRLVPASSVREYLKTPPSSQHVLAVYGIERGSNEVGSPKSIPIMIEWKDFDRTNPHLRLISRRVEGLAQLLSSEAEKPISFRSLDCIGYFEDPDRPRYGLIFSLPAMA
jgi:hypothetical protein